jgi:hypothetical protein
MSFPPVRVGVVNRTRIDCRDLVLHCPYSTPYGAVVGFMDVCYLLQSPDGPLELRDPDVPSIVVHKVARSLDDLCLAMIFVIEDELLFRDRPADHNETEPIRWLPRSVRVERIAACLGGEQYIPFADHWIFSE